MRLLLPGLLVALAACTADEPVPHANPPQPAPPSLSPGDIVGADSVAGDSVLVGDPPTRVPGALRALPRDWTTRTTDRLREAAGVATLQAVRTAQQDGFDRVVFAFDGEVPGVHVEYVDRPAYQCGSGEAVTLAGEAWLRITFQPAQAHTEEGAPTVTERRSTFSLPILREMALTCDFEADVTWVLGLSAPNGYRLLELTNPPRLAVDLRH